MIRHLLIDADVLVYKAACSVEKAFEWEPGQWTYQADANEAKEAVCREIDHIMLSLKGDMFTLALTDTVNFRKAILPTYKANRKATRKPLVLPVLREWLVETMLAKMKPGLEGDDILGIMATQPLAAMEERIIVSIDKDMRTVPGRYAGGDLKVVEIDECMADYWHMIQTLTGDITDGYTGLPGCGPVKADRVLAPASSITGFDTTAAWAAVVAAYEKKGLTEADALVQARVARILRASDYDFTRKEPILWTPH